MVSDERRSAAALGMFGERIARARLEALGYRILAVNWHCRFGELDLIAEEHGRVVFVEVRTRRASHPELSITARKQQRLVRSAQCWLAAQQRPDVDWRIDVMAIELERGGRLRRCEHLIAAVGPVDGAWS